MPYSKQPDGDVTRLVAELERRDKRGDLRLDALESFESYVRGELYPYLLTLAAFVGFSPPPGPPA